MSVMGILGAMTLSPDGNYIAFQLQTPNIDARSYDLSWNVIETRMNGRHWEIDNGGEIILNLSHSALTNGSRYPVVPQWSYDSSWVFYLKRIGGSTQLWRSKKDGSISEQLTYNSSDILSFQISKSEDRIFFTVGKDTKMVQNQLDNEGDHGFYFDDRFYPHASKEPIAQICGIDEEEGRVRLEGILRNCEPAVWIYDTNDNVERRASAKEQVQYQRITNQNSATAKNQDSYLLDSKFTGDGIWLQNEDRSRFPGFRPPLRLFASFGGNTIRCGFDECVGSKGAIEGAWWRPNHNEVIFQRADGSNHSMTGFYSWMLDENDVRTIIQTDDQLVDCSVLETKAYCLHEQWARPRTISSVDLKTGDIQALYDPNPEFGQFTFSTIEKIEWEDEFGNPTHGHLVYPLNYEKGRRYPLVITTYRSRGFLRGAVGDEYPIHVLAANGFMVLSHDMPRRPQRDAVMPAGQAQFKDNYERRSSLSAQEAILDLLNERGLVDLDRVAITGLSDGASQAMYALFRSNRFTTAIASSAFDYAGSFYYSNNRQQREYWRRTLGGAPHEDNNDLYKELSLGLNASQVNAPLLINVSDLELLGSLESFVRLQDAGKPVEMYVFPDEYHIKWQPQHRFAIYKRNVQWLKFWLVGEEESVPISPGQYDRWRKMRTEQCQRHIGRKLPWYCNANL